MTGLARPPSTALTAAACQSFAFAVIPAAYSVMRILTSVNEFFVVLTKIRDIMSARMLTKTSCSEL